jgi:hypothetical protein
MLSGSSFFLYLLIESNILLDFIKDIKTPSKKIIINAQIPWEIDKFDAAIDIRMAINKHINPGKIIRKISNLFSPLDISGHSFIPFDMG